MSTTYGPVGLDKDAYNWEGDPDVNYGADDTLYVEVDASGGKSLPQVVKSSALYLDFSAETDITSDNVISAYLYLYESSRLTYNTDFTIRCVRNIQDWVEDEITWNTKPGENPGSGASSVYVPHQQDLGWKQFDIWTGGGMDSLVWDAIENRSKILNMTLRHLGYSEDYFSYSAFDSMEESPGTRPYIVIEYAPGNGDVSVVVIAATAVAAAPLPTIIAIRNPTISAIAATAPAAVPLASIAIGKTILAVAATAPAAAPLPTIAAIRNPTILAIAAKAPALVPLPNVAISEVILAVTAQAVAAAPLPSVAISKTIEAIVAAAIAAAPLPSVESIRNPTILAVVAEASAAVPLSTILGVWNVTISGVVAQATALSPLPTIATVWNVTVLCVAATAPAAVPLSSVHISEIILAVAAQAVAAVPQPSTHTIWNILIRPPAALAGARVFPARVEWGQLLPGRAHAEGEYQPVGHARGTQLEDD